MIAKLHCVLGFMVAVMLPISADAKCPFERYRVEVEVRSSRTGEPIVGAQVLVFANGSEIEMPGAPDTSRAATGPDGKAAPTYAFDTYSGPGILSADRCAAKLRTLEVVVMHPAYRARRFLVKRIRVSTGARDGVGTILLPQVKIDPLEPLSGGTLLGMDGR